MAKHSAHILELARKGAELQFRDLVHELHLLVELFPHLRDTFDADQLPISFILKSGSEQASTPAPGRRPMSAKARKAASARMKTYWAEKRKAKND